MWTLVHSLDIRWIIKTVQDILWLLQYPKITSVGHPWDKVCCVGLVESTRFLINAIKFLFHFDSTIEQKFVTYKSYNYLIDKQDKTADIYSE